MLSKRLRSKEAKIILVVLVLIGILIASFIYRNYRQNQRYEKQTVMAGQYLKDGNYAQAIEAYKRALSMKNSDPISLSIGLAEAYIGTNDYDKALEVLRSAYQVSLGNEIKEKIEEVTSRKIDYDFDSLISRADKYFTNLEYDKAMVEYEKAKLIKSKEAISYQKIAEAFIELGQYNEAKEEILEGLAITQSETLNKTLYLVDQLLLKTQYEEVIKAASEYIFQENYLDANKNYQAAINLMPKEGEAYVGLAESYIATGKYDNAIKLLDTALEIIQNEELLELKKKALSLKEEKEEREQMLKELYKAINNVEVDQIKKIMQDPFYQENILKKTPVYYSPKGEGDISMGYGMILFEDYSIYSGSIQNGMKKGKGIYFILKESQYGKVSYYYYGEWENNIPNGNGKTGEEVYVKENGAMLLTNVVTSGVFYSGLENGSMIKKFYVEGKERQNIKYIAQNGVPRPFLDENEQPIYGNETQGYAISHIYTGKDKEDEYYFYDAKSLWGVKPYLD